jgi:outer membrane receptor protein involved in Fe transport
MSLSLRLLMLLTLLGAGSGWAQEDDLAALQGLLDSSVVSSASRAAERSDDAPATIATVSRQDLRRYGLQSVAEAVNFLSLGMVTQDPLHAVEAGGRGVLFSGDYGNHVLVLVDGHVMNEAWDGTAYVEHGLGVPIDLIDHLEIITGPGSVLYGSYAMLGVINVVTRQAKDLEGVSLVLEAAGEPPLDARGNPQARASGFGGFGRLSAVAGKSWNVGDHPLDVVGALELYGQRMPQLDFALQSGFTDTDGVATWPLNFGPRATPGTWGGRAVNGYALMPSGLVKASWGEWEAWVKSALYQRNSPYSGTFGNTIPDFDPPGSYERDWWVNVDLRWRRDLTSRVTASVRAYLDTYEFTSRSESSSWPRDGSVEVTPPSADLTRFTFFVVEKSPVNWGGVEAQVAVDWIGDGRFPFMAGVDLRERHYAPLEVYQASDGAEFSRRQAYERWEFLAAPYLQQRAHLWPSLQVNLGLRVDIEQGFAPRPSPRAAVVWSTPWDGKVKAVFSSAFRTPSGYERFTVYPGLQVANPALRPETVQMGELAYDQKLGRHHLGIVGWIARYSDMIRFEPTHGAGTQTGEFWYDNSGSFDNFGATVMVDGVVDRLRYGGSFTLSQNRVDTPLVVAPSWFGNLRCSYEFGDGGPTLGLIGFVAAPRLVDTASATGTDALGNEVRWASGTLSPPQVDVRATLWVPTPVAGLSVRVVVGGSLFGLGPYTAGPRLAPDAEGQSPQLAPNAHRLFGMLSLAWTFGGGEGPSVP